MTTWGWAGLLVGVAAIVGIVAFAVPGVRRMRYGLLLCAGVLVLGGVVMGVVALSGSNSDDSASGPVADGPVTVTVDNRVTDGSGMREDSGPAVLSTVAENYCSSRGCALPDTGMGSGDTVTAICRTEGERTTNGDDSSAADDENPDLYTSTLWYRVEMPDGRTGFLSEVWLSADARGGLGLPAC
ncbi:hypothetical protein [Blastococcus sp. LR1]|uniref:hypothetical protein n=1 Tax=Blastococcus sp. LR1 TaxID=2877000 RepID=UPI001CC90D6E|nr:hypothetical protein [Blastococcus sp. LR1]MCA0144016.1 hypothetical protein [Blastococcus sp. LR1]